MRRILLIIIVIILIGGGAWYFYNKSKSSQTTTDQSSGFKSFFSFGNNNAPDETVSGPTPTQESPSNTPPVQGQSNSPFKQLTSHTVAGYSVFTSSTTITTPGATPKSKPVIQIVVDHIVRYVSRNSGYVYEIKNSGTPIQISNIYAPNIYEASFVDKGKTAVLRFLRDDAKTIATYTVPVPDKNPDGTRTQKNGAYLPDGVLNLAISPDSGTLVRITLDGDTAVLSTTNSANTSRKELFRSPFHEWLVSWGGKNIYLQTKPASVVPGYLYQVDDVNHRLTRVLGNINGLTASVSPNGTYILYSESTSSGFNTKILTTKTGAVRTIGSSILPEKCVWLKNEDLICAGGGKIPEGVYPDAWYAGTVSFSDSIFRIYTGANIFDVLYTPDEFGSFDMTNLQVDEDLGILYFINKPSGILWQFTL